MAPSIALSRRQYLPAVLAFCIGCALTFGAFTLIRSSEEGKAHAEFERAAEVHSAAIRRSTETNLLVLESLHSLYGVRRVDEPEEFAEFVGPFLDRLDGVRALEWIPRVRASERSEFEYEIRRTRFENFEIREQNEDGSMRSALPRPEYFPVLDAQPDQNDDSVIGFDLGSNATRLAALDKARDTGVAAATARISLVQESEKERYGFLVFMPVYEQNVTPASVSARREALQGFILGVFQYPDLVDSALSYIPPSYVDVYLVDESAPAEESLLYFYASSASLKADEASSALQHDSYEMEHVTTIEVGGRRWSIRCVPSASYLQATFSPYPYGALGIGLAFSTMMAFYLLMSVRRTGQLAEFNRRLRTEVEERKKAKAETKELEIRLRQAKKMEALGTLAGGVAHDFNNFLGAISGYAELASESLTEGSEAREDMQEILRISETAKNVIQEILTFSRQSSSVVSTVDPPVLLREAIAIVRVSLPASVDIQEEIEEDCAPISVNPTRMKQVLLNLCTNAYQSMEGEHGVLKIGLSSVSLHSAVAERGFEAQPGDYCSFFISDTGCGISSDKLDRIFDPYYTTKSEREGTGLGLSIVHGIIKDLGGIIHVSSVPGSGSEFRVLIPLATAGRAKEAEQVATSQLTSKGRRVLVVDDEPDVLKITCRMLQRLGYDARGFDDPLEGLRVFESAPEEFDILFVDATMPRMSGLELLEAARKVKDISVVMASGNLNQDLLSRAEEAGVDHVIQKPFTIADLRNLLGELSANGASIDP